MRKDVAFVPVRASDVKGQGRVPEFFTATTCAADVDPTVVEAKVRLCGRQRYSGGRCRRPGPGQSNACGEPVALSAIDREAVNAPAAAGSNSTETVQLDAAANEVVQALPR